MPMLDLLDRRATDDFLAGLEQSKVKLRFAQQASLACLLRGHNRTPFGAISRSGSCSQSP